MRRWLTRSVLLCAFIVAPILLKPWQWISPWNILSAVVYGSALGLFIAVALTLTDGAA